MRVIISIIAFTFLLGISVHAEDVKPKYGPKGAPRATTLVYSSEYFRSHPAPGFWALIGYYVPQTNGANCSAAAAAMILNAARAKLPKTADDKLILQSELVEKVNVEHWKERVSNDGYQGEHGTSLDLFGRLIEASFKAYGFDKVSVRIVHAENTPGAKKDLVAALKQNEKSSNSFIVANFNQQAFTDDADVGHFAPVGAFDAAHSRVLVLDPDREYYEPYWVSVDTFLAGMATKDKGANKNRGYVVVNLGS